MKATNQKKPQGFTLVELLVVIVIIAALAGLSAPMLLKQRKAADKTEAISNVKQIGSALVEFDGDYSGFPDNNTLTTVKENTGTDLSLQGNYSNDYFRQLLANGLKSEKMFYCKTPYTKKGDDNMQGAKALERGEVGFGYIMRSQSEGLSMSGTPSCPVLVAPLYNAEANWTFDLDPFDGKAVVWRLDQSASSLTIRTDTKHVMAGTGEGRKLEDVGEATPWGTDVNPVLRAPEKKGAGS